MLVFSKNKGKWYRFLLKFKNLTDATGIFVGKKSNIIDGTIIGDGSRINGKIIIKGNGKCEIGKFCAFGDEIRIITSNHKITTINLQIALSKKLGFSPSIDDKKNVFIGHNVWIGDRVLIMPGVTIGNGAIIGAGSVVTKNVPNYAVVAGVPSKLIRYRFEKSKQDEIEDTRWWDLTLQELKHKPKIFQ
ncbi:MAG: acetyltransferase [Flavobacteriaceae bacterium]|nr:acetyltransferase [Flavobacteriaceae bacterium]|tara:strand:- start:26877 stop:27443 length:567 start_codon:yes stop_codon:yes gene_type:complete